MRNIVFILGATALNVVLLFLPALAIAGLEHVWSDKVAWLFVLLASAFVLNDLSTIVHTQGAQLQIVSAADRMHARLALLTGLLILWIFWAGVCEHAIRAEHTFTLSRAAGAALMMLGATLRFAAVRALGRQFVTEITVRDGQRLVRTGLYRYVRHPSETGLLAVTLGACMLLGSWTGAALWAAALVPVVLWRLHLEDRQLDAAFTAAFRSYRRDVKRFIPFVI